jgi:hypothetical protein
MLRSAMVIGLVCVASLGCDRLRGGDDKDAGAPGSTSFDASGKWQCVFANTKGASVNETLIFVPNGTSAKVSATGRDANFSSYAGTGDGSLVNGEWNITFKWNNGATPTWIKVKPVGSGTTMTGRRGKFDDKTYEGDYNCTRI